MAITTIDDFYRETPVFQTNGLNQLFPQRITTDVGHFNLFDVAELMKRFNDKPPMPYDRRAYYKISLISGRNKAEYADKVINIDTNALLFATPKVPYHWVPKDLEQAGYFCVFTAEFLAQAKSGVVLDELPIFKPGGFPCFQISEEDTKEITALFRKIQQELASQYAYKYDLIRHYVVELIHYGQKLQPATALYTTHHAAGRVASLFAELLERQFPIESPLQTLSLRTANEYADRLAIHVNYLNRVLKQQTGLTTKRLISNRILLEAKVLLKQTNWTISQIAYSLGFEEVAHFSNFFKKQTACSPLAFRA